MRVQRAWVCLVLVAAVAIPGCNKKSGPETAGKAGASAPPAGGAGGGRPPAAVEILPAISAKIIEYREFTGRTLASHSVEIRPRVSGYLEQAPSNILDPQAQRVESIPSSNASDITNGSTTTGSSTGSTVAVNDLGASNGFVVSAKEGDYVEAGTPLFLIDQRPYLYALEQARGSFLATQAQQVRNQSELKRLEQLKLTNSISDSDLELARATVNVAQGQLETLRASVQRAELDLEFTQIRAPISGFIGRSLVMRKNIVAADTTALTTIVSSDPIHVHFELDEASYLLYRQLVQDDQLPMSPNGGVSVSLALSNEKDFPHQGRIDFTNNTTDANSGNTLLRAEFTNSNMFLAPGLYSRIRVPFSPAHEAVLVPTKSLAMDQQGKYVMVVGADNIVLRRGVTTGSMQGMYTVIRSGLNAGENVVYEGLQKVRDKAPATPVPAQNAPQFDRAAEGA